MQYLLYIYLFLLGASFASFINAMMWRFEKEVKIKEMLLTRSHCDNCNKVLSWYELIPILSWLIQRGRCSSCNKKLDKYHPISEAIMGFSFILIVLFHTNIIWSLVFLCILYALTYSDFHTKSIPATLTHILLAFGLIFWILNFSTGNLYSLVYFSILALAIYILNRFKKSFGFGDILLFLFFALIYPPNTYITFLLTTLYISAFFAIAIVLKNRKNLKKYIPLVPFMFIAYVLTPIIDKMLMIWL